MKDILKKHKIPIISCSVLLSIIALLLITNFGTTKDNVNAKQANPEMASEANIIEDDEIKKSKIADIQDEENENVYEQEQEKDTNGIEGFTGGENKSIQLLEDKTNNEVKKEKKPVQVNDTKSTIASSSIPNAKGDIYTVKSGDTLFLIAQKVNTSVDNLKKLNNLSSDIIYENQTLKIKGYVNNTPSQTSSRGEKDEDLYWLSRIIHSEAQGESYQGKVAVGNVIINRVKSSLFPNTIRGVVFDRQNGYTQFSPVIDGTIYNTPDAESIRAAKDVLSGARPVGNALYFLNPRKSTNFWIVGNRKYMTTIGLHDFYY